MASSVPSSEKLFDQILDASGDVEYKERSYAHIEEVDSTGDPLTFQHLGFLKPITVKNKNNYHAFIFTERWEMPASCSLDLIGKTLHTHGATRLDLLPDGMKPIKPLPSNTLINMVVQQRGGSVYSLLRHFIFKDAVKFQDLVDCLGGVPLAAPFRHNTWGAKKAIVQMYSRIPGWHASFVTAIGKKQVEPQEQEPTTAPTKTAWDSTEEGLAAGINFVNDHAPIANNSNQQLLWMLVQTRKKGSPICGWPMSYIREAISNKTKCKSQADGEHWFPLCVLDLHDVWIEHILPLIVPKFDTFGVLIVGRPGVGKTQIAKILAMAYGRWTIRQADGEDLGVPAGWRRGGRMDVFRETPGVAQEAFMLDDPRPGLPEIDVETVKCFLDVGEAGLCDARFYHAKMCRNQMRLILANDWDPLAEPNPLFQVTDAMFRKMLAPAIGRVGSEHQAAVLKRCTCIIAGAKAVYVRLPSKDEDQPIHTFWKGGVAEDWLKEDHKDTLGAYRRGKKVEYPGFTLNLKKEAEYFDKWLALDSEGASSTSEIRSALASALWGSLAGVPSYKAEDTGDAFRASTSSASVSAALTSSTVIHQPSVSAEAAATPEQKKRKLNLDDSQAELLREEEVDNNLGEQLALIMGEDSD
jgi:hypothetical protein